MLGDKMEIKSGIYKIINIVNGKFYIGSSEHLDIRKKEHFRELNLNKHANKKLQNSYNKYGKENFKFEIIEYVEDVNTLLKVEQKWLDKLKPYNRDIGYNIAINTSAPMKGRKHTEETKKHYSRIRKGSKNPNYGKKLPTWRIEQLKNSFDWTGKKHTDETKAKMSKSSANKKSVICIETNKKYDSITKASIDTNCDISQIAKVCKGYCKIVKGYHFRYLDNKTN